MRIKFKESGFTLAEIMIVLMVIGIISAILLPIARHATPDEDVLRFKKMHNAVLSALREAVNSDEYFLDGNLTVKTNGELADSCYLVNTLADIMNAKKAYCTSYAYSENAGSCSSYSCAYDDSSKIDEFKESITGINGAANAVLKTYLHLGGIIEFSEDLYVIVSIVKPGNCTKEDGTIANLTGAQGAPYCHDENNFDTNLGYISIVFGFDFSKEGIVPSTAVKLRQSESALSFNYAFRYDGKVITDNTVDEWLQKGIQSKE